MRSVSKQIQAWRKSGPKLLASLPDNTIPVRNSVTKEAVRRAIRAKTKDERKRAWDRIRAKLDTPDP